MTQRRERHERFEEQISASLSGDLPAIEQAELEAHLRDCALCRQTLSAFTEQRRMVGGMRHVAPPRDMQARVRGALAAGATLPWWRRPIGVVAGVTGAAAVVAGALLALVVMNGPDNDQVGRQSPSPTFGTPSAATTPSERPAETPRASATSTPPPASPSVAPTAAPSVDPLTESAHFVLEPVDPEDPTQGQELALKDTESGETVMTVEPSAEDEPIGEPVAALAEPDGEWTALRMLLDGKGTEQLYALNPSTQETVALGETLPDPTGFGNRLSWSPDGRYLAYTLIDPEERTSDVWLFDRDADAPIRLTATGDAFSAGFDVSSPMVADDELALWVSVAAETPRTYLVAVPAGDPQTADFPISGDLSPNGPVADGVADGIFLPLVSPDGAYVIFWRGTMAQDEEGLWSFASGGMLFLGERSEDGNLQFGDEQLFPDLQTAIDGEGFNGARLVWGPDGDAYAVWDMRWTGTQQPEGFPDQARVYLGHVSNDAGITPAQALDEADLGLGEDGTVRDVSIAEDGVHLWVTVSRPPAGTLDRPRADLFYIRRHTGTVPDVVEQIGDPESWVGPAIHLPGG